MNMHAQFNSDDGDQADDGLSLRCALDLLVIGLHILDDSPAPPEIGANLDLAIRRLSRHLNIVLPEVEAAAFD